MTRLQKDAVRELAVAVTAALAVVTLYMLTHRLVISLAGLSVFSLSGMFRPSAGDGPVKGASELAVGRQRLWIRLLVLAAVVVLLQVVFLVAFARKDTPAIVIWSPLLVGVLAVPLIVLYRHPVARAARPQPSYDEREREVLRTAQLASLWTFWAAFVLWGVSAGMMCDNGRWHLPGATYALQVFVALWLVRTVNCIAVLWQERRATQ